MRTGDKIRFMTDILRKQMELMRQIDARASITIAFSGVILTYSINTLRNNASSDRASVFLLIIAAVSAIVLSLFALKPPKFLTKKAQRDSLFYHSAIASHSEGEFNQLVKSTIGNIDGVIDQYALEIYNLVKYSIRFRKFFAHTAITVLGFGFLLSLAVLSFRSI